MAGKYDPLHRHLAAAARGGDDCIQLGFDEIDRLTGGLPDSARKYREWWSNSSQPHAWAWREAGWLVAMVNQTAGTVRFERDGAPRERSPELPVSVPQNDATRVPARSAPVNPRGRLVIDARSLPVVGRMGVRVDAEWREAGLIALDAEGDVLFPLLPPMPGIYRVTLSGAPGQERGRIYIGETDDLRRRATNYRNPGPTQDTNIRLNAALKAQLTGGGTARLAVVTAARVQEGDTGDAVVLDLSRKAPRLLVENAALVMAQLAGDVDIENLE